MRAPASILALTALSTLLVAVSGCAAQTYVSEGPDYAAAPPKTVQVRVLGVRDAAEPEAIAIDGRFICHNYDPARRSLPKCPRFRDNAEDIKFELETFVAVGEHRVSVVGWGESSEIKAFKVFMADVPVLCEFDASGVECVGVGTPSIIDSVDALMEDAPSEPAQPPPSLDAPEMGDDESAAGGVDEDAGPTAADDGPSE